MLNCLIRAMLLTTGKKLIQLLLQSTGVQPRYFLTTYGLLYDYNLQKVGKYNTPPPGRYTRIFQIVTENECRLKEQIANLNMHVAN